MIATRHDERTIRKLTAWVDRLRSARIFRSLTIEPEINKAGMATITATLSDGMATVKTKPFSFHVPTMEFNAFYERLEDELTAAFREHVRRVLAPELVMPGVSPVEYDAGLSEGEDDVYKF